MSKVVWQEAPLSAAALNRIEESAGLNFRSQDRPRVRRALQRLANEAIHRAFDRPLGVRDLAPLKASIDRDSGAANRKFKATVRAIRVKGREPFPRVLSKSETTRLRALQEAMGLQRPPALNSLSSYRTKVRGWIIQAVSMARGRGRPELQFEDRLIARLLTCFRVLYQERPDASRGHGEKENPEDGTWRRLGCAMRFVAAFYIEVGRAIEKCGISDPSGRRRSSNWRVPSHAAMAKRIRAAIVSTAYAGFDVLDDGTVLAR